MIILWSHPPKKGKNTSYQSSASMWVFFSSKLFNQHPTQPNPKKPLSNLCEDGPRPTIEWARLTCNKREKEGLINWTAIFNSAPKFYAMHHEKKTNSFIVYCNSHNFPNMIISEFIVAEFHCISHNFPYLKKKKRCPFFPPPTPRVRTSSCPSSPSSTCLAASTWRGRRSPSTTSGPSSGTAPTGWWAPGCAPGGRPGRTGCTRRSRAARVAEGRWHRRSGAASSPLVVVVRGEGQGQERGQTNFMQFCVNENKKCPSE